MPDQSLRGLKPEEVLRAFEKAGGVRRSGKGSHANVKMKNGQIVTIPLHTEVKVGLLKAAIKKAGLSVEEFLEFIGG